MVRTVTRQKGYTNKTDPSLRRAWSALQFPAVLEGKEKFALGLVNSRANGNRVDRIGVVLPFRTRRIGIGKGAAPMESEGGTQPKERAIQVQKSIGHGGF